MAVTTAAGVYNCSSCRRTHVAASGRTSWRHFVKVRNAHRGTRTGLQFIRVPQVPLLVRVHHGMVSGRFARHPPPSASLKCRCSPQYDGLSHRFRGGSVISIAGLSRPKGTNLCGFFWPMPSARLFVPVYLSSSLARLELLRWFAFYCVGLRGHVCAPCFMGIFVFHSCLGLSRTVYKRNAFGARMLGELLTFIHNSHTAHASQSRSVLVVSMYIGRAVRHRR